MLNIINLESNFIYLILLITQIYILNIPFMDAINRNNENEA